MQQKTYLSALGALGVIATLALAAPALAASVNVPVEQEEQAETASGHPAGWDEGGPMRGGVQRALGIFGTVASVNGATLTVTQKARPEGESTDGAVTATYTIDATNATVMKNGASSSLSNIAVGDTVMVEGTISGTSVTATVIRDGMMQRNERLNGTGKNGQPPASIIQGNGQPIVGGSVTAVSGSTLTITNKSNVAYTVDATNAVIEKNNATSTLSSVTVGDNVIVQGTINGSAVTASSVIDQGTAPVVGGTTGNSEERRGGFFGFFSGIGGFFAHLFGF